MTLLAKSDVLSRAMMTASERSMGRFMRAPDHPAGGDAPAAPPAGDPPAAAAPPPAAAAPPAAPAGDPPVASPAGDPPAASDWRSGITDPEHKEFATRLATPADAVKVALDLRKANSAMIKVPGKDASAEDRAKFNKAIGVPETAEGYKFELGREPTEADKAIQGNLAKIAFDNGIPATAMTALSKAVTELATAAKAEENRVALAGREAADAALRKELGADYNAQEGTWQARSSGIWRNQEPSRGVGVLRTQDG
ncbi:hypothetical protein [Bradyrhizobium sp. 62]|uniref:hypothetical protein n=1 Tax=Bradyrhizobium sp. 62 TaxID=1043588 RepID=UPI001FFAC019|nr:hypothetical protein [Bradyrhizobium sp. 62]MCK1367630.1 hypothetical protein [Bradyrhizobium sp. 62]